MKANKISIITISILLGLFFIERAICQENFQPGFILNQNGDTLRGLIDNRDWEKNPDAVTFKISENSSVSIYTPIEIKGFRVYNDLYFSAIVQAESSPNDLEELSFEPALILRTDTTFLRAMFLGTKNLYFYNDKNGKPQFYLKQWPDFELLVYKKFFKTNEPTQKDYEPSMPAKRVKENSNYLGQLLLYLQDCPSIQSKINSSEYNQKSLNNLFTAYYKCSENEVGYQFVKDKASINFGVVAGISITKLKFVGNNPELKKYLDFETPNSIKFSGGLYMDVVLARNAKKWSLYNELLLSSYENKGVHLEEYTHENNYYLIDTQLGYTYLKLNTMVRFKYPVKNDFSVFLNAGIFNGFMLTETNSVKKDHMFWDTHSLYDDPITNTSKYGIGYLGGIGSSFRKYSIEARFEYNILYSADLDPMSLYFLLGYKF